MKMRAFCELVKVSTQIDHDIWNGESTEWQFMSSCTKLEVLHKLALCDYANGVGSEQKLGTMPWPQYSLAWS